MNWQKYLVEDQGGDVGAVVLDPEYRVRAVSDSVLERSGWVREEMLERSAFDLVHPDDLKRGAVALQGALAEDSREGMYRLAVSDGYENFGLRRVHVGSSGAVVLAVSEVSESLRATELSEDLMRSVKVLSREFSFEDVIKAAFLMIERQLPGVCLTATIFEPDGTSLVFPQTPFSSVMYDPIKEAFSLEMPGHVTRAIQNRKESEWRLHSRMGSHDEEMPERATFAMLDDEVTIGYLEAVRPWATAPDGHEWLVYSSAAKVVEVAVTRHRLDEALRRAADHDPLTGLLNRRGFADAVSEGPELGGAVLVVDLDDFSWVNNHLGHAAGDAALTMAATRLSEACPDGGVVARLGGDEFVAWIPNVDQPMAQVITQALHLKMTSTIFYNGRSHQIRSSIGAVMLEPNEGIEQAIRRADVAMYQAKASGGGCVVYGMGIRVLEPVPSTA